LGATRIRMTPTPRQGAVASGRAGAAIGLGPEGPGTSSATDLRAALIRARVPLPVLLYMLAVAVPIGFNAGPLALTTLRVLMLLLVVPLLVQLFTGRLGRVFLTDVLFVLHIGWATVALAANNPALVVQQMGSVGIEFLGGYLVGRAYIRSAADFVAMCRWLMIIVCATLRWHCSRR
jgi:hypothetical protein